MEEEEDQDEEQGGSTSTENLWTEWIGRLFRCNVRQHTFWVSRLTGAVLVLIDQGFLTQSRTPCTS